VRLLPKDALTSELGFPELLLAAYASAFASVLAQAFPRWDLWAHPGHEPPPAVPSRCEGLSAQATPDPCGEHRPEDLRAAHESGEALAPAQIPGALRARRRNPTPLSNLVQAWRPALRDPGRFQRVLRA
jgi:hypothetical protein